MEDSYTWTYSLFDLLGFSYYNIKDYANAVAAAACALSYEPSNLNLQSNYQVYLKALKES